MTCFRFRNSRVDLFCNSLSIYVCCCKINLYDHIDKSKIEEGIRSDFAQKGSSYSSMTLKFEPSTSYWLSCFICFIVSAICWYRLNINGFCKGFKLLKMTLTFFKIASDSNIIQNAVLIKIRNLQKAFKEYWKYVIVLNTGTNTIAEGALAWVNFQNYLF